MKAPTQHTSTTNIYLDVDGVLLNEGEPSEGVDNFIDYVLSNYPDSTFWLTTRCNGNADETLDQLRHLFTDTTLSKLKQVKLPLGRLLSHKRLILRSPSYGSTIS